jgi:hypothetical protein
MSSLGHRCENRLAFHEWHVASTVGTSQRGAIQFFEMIFAVRTDEQGKKFVHEAYLL